MEVISYISIGAVAAFVISRIVSVITNMFSSPIVQQVVKMALMVRDSLPPAILSVGTGAVIAVKHVLWALIELVRGMPPVVVEALKNAIMIVAEALHLVLHVVYQGLVFIKNVYNVVIVVAKSIFVVLRGVNEGFMFVWNFSDNVLNPFLNWLFSHPVPSTNWHILVSVILLGMTISMTAKYIARKRKLKEN